MIPQQKEIKKKMKTYIHICENVYICAGLKHLIVFFLLWYLNQYQMQLSIILNSWYLTIC